MRWCWLTDNQAKKWIEQGFFFYFLLNFMSFLMIFQFPKIEKPKISFSVKQLFLHYKYKQHFGVKGLLLAVCNVIVLIITYNSRELAGLTFS